MTARRSLAAFCCAVLAPCLAGAQPVPLVRVHAADRSAWFERYSDSRHGPEQSETWSRSFKVGPNGSLDLSNVAGEVVVTGGAGDEIRVEATKRVRARDANEGKQMLSALTIEAMESGGRVEIHTQYPRDQRGRDISAEVDYEVQVPIGTAVSIHTVSGDIRASKLKGEARLDSVSGNIEATGVWQVSRLKTVSGDVTLTDGGAADAFAAGTVSGSLITRRVKARSMDVQTVSGDVMLDDVACEKAQVRSVSGDVEYDGPFAKGGRYEFVSHSGDLRVAVAGGAGFELTANTFSGDFRSELPGLNPPGRGDDDMPGNHEVRATIGDGSALVIVKTFSGDLLVTGAAGGKEKVKQKQ
jgi:hypothetical protein